MGCCTSAEEHQPLVPERTENLQRATTVTAPTAVRETSTSVSGRTNSNQSFSHVTSTLPTTATMEQTFDEEKDFRTKCRALWDWNGDPTDPVQIAFKAGDIIALIDKEEDGGWWYGENLRTKAVGFFPGNYVEVLQRNWKVDANKVNPKIAALQTAIDKN